MGKKINGCQTLSKEGKGGYDECEILIILEQNIRVFINVWNNLFLIEYNNIMQTNGI